jgi:hypothetical protein
MNAVARLVFGGGPLLGVTTVPEAGAISSNFPSQ